MKAIDKAKCLIEIFIRSVHDDIENNAKYDVNIAFRWMNRQRSTSFSKTSQ